jgi:hypothetical protein
MNMNTRPTAFLFVVGIAAILAAGADPFPARADEAACKDSKTAKKYGSF